MTKKRKRYPTLQEKIDRPWCFYCERDFDDLKILISHQKAKHFKCDRCGRRLNTAGGLSVHMTQVHKENLTHVENAIGGRQGLDIEIFGMEGVPQEIIEQHNHQVTTQHFEDLHERARKTGNPVHGLYGDNTPRANKRPYTREDVTEITLRAEKWWKDVKNGTLPDGGPVEPPTQPAVSLSQQYGTTPSQAAPFAPGAQQYSPGQLYSQSAPGLPPAYAAVPPFGRGPSPRPGGVQALPQRPPYGGPSQPGIDPSQSGLAASVDDLISSAAAAAAASNQSADTIPEKEKKSRKDKGKMIYSDDSISPEEKMATLPRYSGQLA